MRVLFLNYHPYTHLGGSELQCDLLAAKLTELGADVVYGALNAAKVVGPEVDYPVRPIPRRTFDHFLDVMLETEPDVIYWRAGRGGLLAATLAARTVGARFVFAIAAVTHTQAFSSVARPKAGSVSRMLKNQMLTAADVAKTRMNFEAFRFVDALASNTVSLLPSGAVAPFPRLRRTIYNAFEPETDGRFDWPRPFVVWVANLKRNKNPNAYLELARRCSDLDLDFLMVGGIHQAEYAFVQDASQTPENFHYMGPQSPVSVNTMLAASEFLVHTCDPEGFSGNFIQAWWQAKPTLTLFHDPDGLIETRGCGRLAGSLDVLERDVRALHADTRLREEMGASGFVLAREQFDLEQNACRYLEFFEEVAAL